MQDGHGVSRLISYTLPESTLFTWKFPDDLSLMFSPGITSTWGGILFTQCSTSILGLFFKTLGMLVMKALQESKLLALYWIYLQIIINDFIIHVINYFLVQKIILRTDNNLVQTVCNFQERLAKKGHWQGLTMTCHLCEKGILVLILGVVVQVHLLLTLWHWTNFS